MSATAVHARSQPARRRGLPPWWPLAALTLLAAALRFSTLGLQSFWYDEAFTPVHVLHPSLWATLRSVAHTENTPPLWYVLAWLCERVFGAGEWSLRLPSALAGVATVPVAWAIGRELSGRRAAIACAALLAVGPLFVWYSQEARAYGLFVLSAALAFLCFLRVLREPSPRRMAAFALAGALALLSHYFAVFLLLAMCAWLLWRHRRAWPAVAAIVLVGAALVPLVSAQGGHGTQWIGSWPLSERLVAIPQYYLLGVSGEPLGHGIELLVALPLLAAAATGLVRVTNAELRSAAIAAAVAAAGILLPLLLVAFGKDYLAPRNLVGAMIPVTAAIAVLGASPRAGTLGAALLAAGTLGWLALTVDVDLSPRLQRGDWRGVAERLRDGASSRAITTVELGSAPLEHYLPGVRYLPPGSSATVSEIDETGYAPLRPSAGRPPAPGFHLLARLDVHGLIVYRFLAPRPLAVRESTLRRHVITLARPEVLVTRETSVVP